MAETIKTTKKAPNLPAVLAFIFGAVVIVVSMGSLLLTLLAVVGISGPGQRRLCWRRSLRGTCPLLG